MDATENDVPGGYDVQGFPTIYFAPKNGKETPRRYDVKWSDLNGIWSIFVLFGLGRPRSRWFHQIHRSWSHRSINRLRSQRFTEEIVREHQRGSLNDCFINQTEIHCWLMSLCVCFSFLTCSVIIRLTDFSSSFQCWFFFHSICYL